MRFLIPLTLLSTLLLVGTVFALPTLDNIDHDMRLESQLAQSGLYVSQTDHTFTPYNPPPDYTHVRNFEIRALELAHDGVALVDTYRNPQIETTTTGVRKYFYSVIEPNTVLGREMGLGKGKNKMAFVLWRHEIERLDRHHVKLVHVDTVDHVPGIQWPLQTLQSLIEHH